MGRKLPQFIAATCVCIGALGTGTVLGWTSNITDDLKKECSLAPFTSGSTVQHIPFVILPLKGQIIHPSREISFTGLRMPVCAITGSKYMTENGWTELRNPIDDDVPFRLYRDEGRTFLQWYGSSDLRGKLFGRLVIVHLMCREVSNQNQNEKQAISSPCIAFRIDGSPYKYINNITEVIFIPDGAHASTEAATSTHLTATEYVAIGICSVLLGLVYVASVFLYLHLRRKNKPRDLHSIATAKSAVAGTAGADLRASEEGDNVGMGMGGGVVKSNPLLAISSHYLHAPTANNNPAVNDHIYSDTNSSDDMETPPDIIRHHEHQRKKHQTTSALVHYQLQIQQSNSLGMHRPRSHFSMSEANHDSTTEKLPEENVSIVETMETREERPENIRALTATTRRKLYFNPAYFEPQLLLTPPPAAVEFLCKIREVISIAKEKMALKRFSPSLLNIPEEEDVVALEGGARTGRTFGTGSGVNSVSTAITRANVNLKRENSRRRTTCGGCPGCEPLQMAARGRSAAHARHNGGGKLPEFAALPACQNCQILPIDNKQTIIRKWLEDIPATRNVGDTASAPNSTMSGGESPRRLRSPARSLPPYHERATSDRRDLRSVIGSGGADSAERPHRLITSMANDRISTKPKRKTRKSHHPPPPPVPVPVAVVAANKQNQHNETRIMNLPPPDMIQEAMEVDRTERVSLTQKQQEEIIKGLTFHQNLVLRDNIGKPQHLKSKFENYVDYETDSLERIARKAVLSEYGSNGRGLESTVAVSESSSSQASPSLSGGGGVVGGGTATLPDHEEMTMRNAIFNTRTGHQTISKINVHENSAERIAADHQDYQVIITRRGFFDKNINGSLQVRNGNGGSEYSLVSEVYVNNGYNYGSAPSSPGSSSPSSTMDRRALHGNLKLKYEKDESKPGGKLLIEVEDCADHYIPVCESDGFEPDTLDRKPTATPAKYNEFSLPPLPLPPDGADVDSANAPPAPSKDRPAQILLRTTGSFRSDALAENNEKLHSGNFTRVFGSLRDIYEAKMKGTCKQQQQQQEDETSTKQTTGMLYNFIDGFVESVGDEKGRILTLEERHSKRQRAKHTLVQPDVIPPPLAPSSPDVSYANSTTCNGTQDSSMVSRSIPKNGNCRSAANNRCIGSNDGNSEKNAGSGTPATGASSSLADFELCLLQRRHRPKTDGNVAVRQDTTHDSIDNAMDVILTKQNDDEYVLHLCQVSMALSKNRNGRSDAARRAIRIGASTEFAKMTAAGSKEDSGYLSGGEEIATAAGEEKGDAAQTCGGVSWRRTSCSISEEDTEGSFEDDGCTSESGAESIETHSVFFDKIATGESAAALAKPANDKDGDDETRNVCCAARVCK
ncbi:unnamed protein product [Acanthoscelides obtectus]|uniref:Uncharacterized protein n=1 Tax=Acanthoscelides obtectus TaxID=200917 RepID=A0A9P0PYR4_ACAOB|nr:unnamed protein product [Acanthoscelides obtectus]CAK1665290.1 hypothetical protein AOBTE_LOCUS24742 [Acanthoscelides obtectus]